MKTIVRLESPLFNKAGRSQTISNFVRKQSRDFKNLTKRRMLQSKPTGRLYARKRGAGFTRFHQASASGQRPAIDTGTLLNSISDRRIGAFKAEAFAGAAYAKYLQSARLNRPIMSDRDKAEARAKANRDAITMLKTVIR